PLPRKRQTPLPRTPRTPRPPPTPHMTPHTPHPAPTRRAPPSSPLPMSPRRTDRSNENPATGPRRNHPPQGLPAHAGRAVPGDRALPVRGAVPVVQLGPLRHTRGRAGGGGQPGRAGQGRGAEDRRRRPAGGADAGRPDLRLGDDRRRA